MASRSGRPRWPRSRRPPVSPSRPSPRCVNGRTDVGPATRARVETCSRSTTTWGRARRGRSDRGTADGRARLRRQAQRLRRRDHPGRARRRGRSPWRVADQPAPARARRARRGPARGVGARPRRRRPAAPSSPSSTTSPPPTCRPGPRAAAAGRHRPAEPAPGRRHQRRLDELRRRPRRDPAPARARAPPDRLRRRARRRRPATRPGCTATGPRWRRNGSPVPEEYVRCGALPLRGRRGARARSLLDLPRAADRGVRRPATRPPPGVIEAGPGRAACASRRTCSVVGFDDTQVARFASPPLTTVRQPLREMGGVALRTALRLAAGEKLESHHVELATELVVRSSTAPPPRDQVVPHV